MILLIYQQKQVQVRVIADKFAYRPLLPRFFNRNIGLSLISYLEFSSLFLPLNPSHSLSPVVNPLIFSNIITLSGLE